MRTKILPISNPTITTATGYADALAILQSYDLSLDWVYSHYVQLFVLQNMPADTTKDFWPLLGHTESFFVDFDIRRIGNTLNDGIFSDREKCPFLNTFEIPSEMIEYYAHSYVKFMKKCIDIDLYIYAIVDVSNISLYKNGTTHPILIYGYDDKQKVFYFGDFLGDRAYHFDKCAYSDIECAFSNVKDAKKQIVKSVNAIRFVRNGSFTLDISYIRDMVKQYLSPDSEQQKKFSDYATSYYTVLNWKARAYLGVNFYSFLVEFMQIQTAMGMYPFDIIPFHALYDHKKMMYERILFLQKKGYLNTKNEELSTAYFDKVLHQSLIVRNLVLKFNTKRNMAIINTIKNFLISIRDAEIPILQDIFDIRI
jgi:hypothetical protein